MNSTGNLDTSFSLSLLVARHFVADTIPTCEPAAGIVPKGENLNTAFTAADKVITVTG